MLIRNEHNAWLHLSDTRIVGISREVRMPWHKPLTIENFIT